MTKNEIIEKIAKKVGLTKKASREAYEAVFGTIRETLGKGERVVLSGFGTFKIRNRVARRGRNPQTGAEIQISARKTPGFVAGKGLKKAVK